jgi:hypothetical protein
MAAHLRHSLVLAWALPHQVLQAQLPRGLVVDRYGDVGFVAAAMVQAERLRPAGAPAWLGDDPFLVGWRIFARHAGPDGRRRRGLFILRSDTDRRALVAGGNLLTRYNWRRSAIAAEVGGGRMTVRVTSAGGLADLEVTAELGRPGRLPAGTPFASLADARRFAGPLPWTFDHEPETGSMVLVLGRRSQWRPEPVDVRVERCTFFDHGPLAGTRPVLANAFHVAGLDYRWERGIRVPAVQAVTS